MRYSRSESILVTIAVTCLAAATLNAATLARYQFNATNDWSSVDTELKTTANTYTNEVGGSISAATFTKLTPASIVNGSANTLAAALASDDYDSFTITVPNGVSVTPETFTYDYMASSIYETFTSYILFDADEDGFDTGDLLGSTSLTGTMGSNQESLDNQIDLSSLGSLGNTTLEFRIYYSDNSISGTRYHKIDNIMVNAGGVPTTLAEYGFISGSASSTDIDSLTTAADYELHGGGGISSTYDNRHFAASIVGGSTLAGALSAGDYDKISVTISGEYRITPDQFIYDYIMQNGYGTFTTYLLFDDEGDGFDTGDELGHISLVADPAGSYVTNLVNSIDLSSIGTLNERNVEMRLYYTDGSTSADRIHRVDNVYLYATILPPLPKGTMIILK